MMDNNCMNCGKDISKGGHFAPPSMGEPGFFICDKPTMTELERIVELRTDINKTPVFAHLLLTERILEVLDLATRQAARLAAAERVIKGMDTGCESDRLCLKSHPEYLKCGACQAAAWLEAKQDG